MGAMTFLKPWLPTGHCSRKKKINRRSIERLQNKDVLRVRVSLTGQNKDSVQVKAVTERLGYLHSSTAQNSRSQTLDSMRKFQVDKQRKLTGAEESGCDVDVTIPADSENRKTEYEKIGKHEGRGGREKVEQM